MEDAALITVRSGPVAEALRCHDMSTHLVDDQRSAMRTEATARRLRRHQGAMTEAFRFVLALIEQHLHVVEQEAAAMLISDVARRAALCRS